MRRYKYGYSNVLVRTNVQAMKRKIASKGHAYKIRPESFKISSGVNQGTK